MLRIHFYFKKWQTSASVALLKCQTIAKAKQLKIRPSYLCKSEKIAFTFRYRRVQIGLNKLNELCFPYNVFLQFLFIIKVKNFINSEQLCE